MMFRRTFLALATVSAMAFPALADDPKDIYDTAAATEGFTTFVAAIEAADLVETLKGEGPFTVFAPTDEAFATLPEGTLENLMKPENKDELVKVLTYHVIPGTVMAADLTDGMEPDTALGVPVMVMVTDSVNVGGATVVTPDIPASNGVIHVVDTVIIPPVEE